MHEIQSEIIRYLTGTDFARYTSLKPKDIDGNLFMYHLNQLMQSGYIEKIDKKYTLSGKGKQLAGIINIDTGLPRPQPKVIVMLYVRDEQGRYLLFRWKRQPFYGLISLPYGKADFGKSLMEAVNHERQTKTNLKADFSYLGSVAVLTTYQDEVINHMLAQVFKGENVSGEVKSKVRTGECFWGNPADFREDEFVPGFYPLLDVIEQERFREAGEIWSELG